MKKYFKLGLSLFMLLFIFGCSSVHQIGQIGTHEVWQVKTRDWVTPSSVTVFTHNINDGAIYKIEGGLGKSGFGQIAGPSAVVGAAYFIGKGIGDSGDTTNIQQNQDASGSGISAESLGALGSNDGSNGIINNISVDAKAGSISSSESNATGVGSFWDGHPGNPGGQPK